jgi:hypothetical protein
MNFRNEENLDSDEQLERVVLVSLDNFGEPERLCCGDCGKWFNSKQYFLDHFSKFKLTFIGKDDSN